MTTAAVRRILLATDLSAICDRALDRATQLAALWGAALHVVHAFEPDAPEHARHAIDEQKRRLEANIRRDAGNAEAIHVETGSAAQAIVAVAERERCDLVVVGSAAERTAMARIEGTVDRVVRTSPASVLVVRDRVRHPYRHVLVGTDFTNESRQALQFAVRAFDAAPLMLLHAFGVPYGSFLPGDEQAGDYTLELRAMLDAEVDAIAIPSSLRDRLQVAAIKGSPASVLRDYVLAGDADLTVIGAHPRGVVFDAVVGNSRGIIEAVPNDVLVVRATPA